MITIHHYLILSAIMFALGFLGIILRKNLLIVLMSLEVMMNAINLALIAISRYLGKMDGHVVAFFVMAIAAAEAAIGLAIVISLFRNRRTIKTTDWRLMGG